MIQWYFLRRISAFVVFTALTTVGCSGTTYSTLFKKFDLDFSTVTISDTNVTSATADGIYKAGDTVSIQVTLKKPVTVDTTGGTPQLTLATGNPATTPINYVSGSGTNTLTFTYTVAASNYAADLDYTATTALNLNGGTIKYADDGANADLTLSTPGATGSLSANKALVIDAVDPQVSQVTASTADGAYTTGATITVQVVFSEPVTVTGTPQLSLATGSPATTVINYASGSGTNTLAFTYTVAAGNTSADLDYDATTSLSLNGGTIHDAATNNAVLTLAAPAAAGSLAANKALVIDTTTPAAPVISALDSADDTGSSNSDRITKNTSALTLTGTSEANATVKLYITNSSGTLLQTVTADGVGNWSGDIALTEGVYSIVGTATDSAGNVSSDSAGLSLTIDMTPPSGYTVATDQAQITTANQTAVSFTFASAEVGTTYNHSFSSSGGGSPVTGSGTIVTATDQITGLDLSSLPDGTITLSVTLTDTAGNVGTAATNTKTKDATAPSGYSVVIDQSYINGGNVNVVSITYSAAEVGATYNYSFSSTGGGTPVTGTGTVATASAQITGLDLTALADGYVTVSFTLTDSFGNTGTAATNTKTKDLVAPVISATSPATSAGVTTSAMGYTLSEDCATAQAVWTQTGGTADAASPHTRTFTGSELNSGAHSNISFGSNPLVGAAIYTIAWDCTDAAGNSATQVTATGVLYSDGPPVVQSALVLDSNFNGKIDTYKITFNKNIQDSTFPGYVANALGNAQTDWLIAGYTNIKLLHGSAVTFETDTANDSVIYIRFNENVSPCDAAEQTGCDTDVKPDITTSATPGVSDGVLTLGQLGVATVTEADGAAPVTVRALSLGPTSLDVTFSEPMTATQANVQFNYTLTGSLTVSAAARDGVNFRVVHLTTSPQTGGTSYTLTVNTTLRDLTNINLITNTNPTSGLPANQAQFTGVEKPVVVSIVTKSSTTLLLEINEAIVEASGVCSGQTACASVYENLSLPVLHAVASNASGTPTAGNSKYFLLTVNPMIEGQAYTTKVLQNTMESAATAQKMGSTNNSATFTGDGNPAMTISGDTATQCPTPTNLPPLATAATRVVVQFDQTVDATALTATNYKITGCMTGVDCASGTGGANATGASVVTSMGSNKYAVDFTNTFDTDTSEYQLTVSGVKDSTGNTIALPGTGTFRCGTDTTPASLISVNVVSATAGATIVMLNFTEALDNVTGNIATNYAGDYTGGTTNWGNNVVTAAVQGNPAQVLVTFQPALPNGGHQMGVRNVKDLASPTPNAMVDNGINNVQPFMVNAPVGFQGGPVFNDPFGDGTASGQVVRYDGKLYVGPDLNSAKLFEMNYGLTQAQTITLDADGVFGTPFASFMNFTTKYTGCNTSFSSPPGPTQQCASQKQVQGIDTLYAACVGGTSTPGMTGSDCTAAAGTEYFLIGARKTDIVTPANYRSFWTSTTKSSVNTNFTFTERDTNDTGGTYAYRAMNMLVFKDQLFINFGTEQSGGGRGARVCLNPAGCTGATNPTYLQSTTLGDTAAMKRIGAMTTNSNPLRNGSYAGGGAPYRDSNLGNNAFSAINVMYEYDNDGTGGNTSQLYIANGGFYNGALGSARSGSSDGGIMRTVLARSTKAVLPDNCGTGASGAGCLNYWEDLTPDALTDWSNYISIPWPQNTGVNSTPDCAGGYVEMECVLPFNTFVPALKAIPYMRTAPNGDLYILRNACSTTNLNWNGKNGAGGKDFRIEKQVCPKGYEVPQLWMMPKSCGNAASCQGAWVLVAEYGSTGKTNMAGNTTDCGAPNKCLNNTHLTLLETVGSYLYIGYDNATDGANIWRTDMTSVVSGSTPAESAFVMVNIPGIETGGGGANQKLFSHITVNDAGKDWLIITTRDGSSAVTVYRTANDQN